jgi:hypothetical protein
MTKKYGESGSFCDFAGIKNKANYNSRSRNSGARRKMQNKANLLNVQMALTSIITKYYGNYKSLIRVKNKANSKPIPTAGDKSHKEKFHL